jgi:hypothetical protein
MIRILALALLALILLAAIDAPSATDKVVGCGNACVERSRAEDQHAYCPNRSVSATVQMPPQQCLRDRSAGVWPEYR